MPGYTKSGGDYVEYAICRDDLVKISPTVVINGVLAMNIYDSLFSSSGMLNEQIAKEVFSVLAGQDTALAILDPGGTFWATDDRFSEVFADQEHLRRLCERIDDGDDPIITQIDDFSVVAAQLATNQINCGYLIIILPGYNPETTMVSMDLIEIVIGQMGLIAGLIEKNNRLHHLRLKQLSFGTENSVLSSN